MMSIITWTPEMSTDMLGYVSDVFSDLSGLLTIIIGVGVGLIVIGAIISAIRR